MSADDVTDQPPLTVAALVEKMAGGWGPVALMAVRAERERPA